MRISDKAEWTSCGHREFWPLWEWVNTGEDRGRVCCRIRNSRGGGMREWLCTGRGKQYKQRGMGKVKGLRREGIFLAIYGCKLWRCREWGRNE